MKKTHGDQSWSPLCNSKTSEISVPVIILRTTSRSSRVAYESRDNCSLRFQFPNAARRLSLMRSSAWLSRLSVRALSFPRNFVYTISFLSYAKPQDVQLSIMFHLTCNMLQHLFATCAGGTAFSFWPSNSFESKICLVEDSKLRHAIVYNVSD